nr:hypothetical protein [Paraburkholderia rhizosphaerae]
MDQGRASAFIGAKVYCHTCRTAGIIAAKGPRLHDFILAREQALEGDICLCKCDPPPIMIASQRRSYQEFTTSELTTFQATTDDAGAGPAEHAKDDLEHYFEIVDARTETPIEGMVYKLSSNGQPIVYDETLSDGRTQAVTLKDHPYLTLVAWRGGDVR